MNERVNGSLNAGAGSHTVTATLGRLRKARNKLRDHPLHRDRGQARGEWRGLLGRYLGRGGTWQSKGSAF